MRLTFPLRVRFSELSELTKRYGNFPDSYLKRRMILVEHKTPRGFPQYLPRTIARRDPHFDQYRPWTEQFRSDNNSVVRHKKIFVEPIRDWCFFKGDRVEILVGKDKGKQGHVIQVIPERNWVFVEGLNCKIECQGKTKTFPGYYYQDEQPLLVPTEISLVDPSDLQAVEIEWRYTEDGERVRVSKRTGRIIPEPLEAGATRDYKSKSSYVESKEKDTTEKDLLEVTFKPTLQTFEMEVMKEMEIKEDRIPAPTYWY